MQVKQFQIARVYDNGHFIGLGVAVDGVLLDGSTAAMLSTTPSEPAKLSVEFVLGVNGRDELGDSIRIDVN
ncbi:hypothetical protein FOT62_22865 [Serratia marcescens]|uniref:Uncharacterized protein n=1 Tax=Serratia marcescens TaxID=615 RepID=A0A5C7BT48_SERMA|nr:MULTISPECIES: hypothetical protein [Serratia]TXE27160.1 hypothetical protein FOT62_22865 [Serratia marcescens]TXE55283.1 hypothetical protein FOT56_25300 [Serratia marcescens]